MKKNKIDKKKFLFKFLENFSSSSDMDECYTEYIISNENWEG